MITLKTLPSATAQEVFDQVAKHLLTQREKSLYGEKCAYRGDNSLKCAAGCLIADNEYNADVFENLAWTSLVRLNVVPSAHVKLIRALQRIHDTIDPRRWKEALEYLAVTNELKFEGDA